MICYIALGSNQDNPTQQVIDAFEDIASLPATNLINKSSLYNTKPMGPIEQDDFINAAVSIDTKLEPEILLSHLKQIEKAHDRKSSERWGPRTLDLDLLLYGNEIINIETLTIPHPGIIDRDFVYVPLLEIEPELILPSGEPLKSLIKVESERYIL